MTRENMKTVNKIRRLHKAVTGKSLPTNFHNDFSTDELLEMVDSFLCPLEDLREEVCVAFNV